MSINIDPESLKALAEDVDLSITSLLKIIKDLQDRVKTLENK